MDRAFDQVIRACASRKDEGDWINGEIIDSYRALHQTGFAHSIDVWQQGRLVGGLYGVSLRGAFFGESMFFHVDDASKVALNGLVERLRARRFHLLDIQWLTPHFERLGAIEVPRRAYLELLDSGDAGGLCLHVAVHSQPSAVTRVSRPTFQASRSEITLDFGAFRCLDG